jgi:leucine dehydrogenase
MAPPSRATDDPRAMSERADDLGPAASADASTAEVRALADLGRVGFEHVEIVRDDRIGLLACVVLHSTRLGPAFGGIRRFAYEDFGEAIADAIRLATAMTVKCALAGVPGGGGKAVIWQRPGLDRGAAYRRIGEVVERLAGRYYTGPDVGTTEDDLRAVAEGTRYVAKPGDEGPGDLSEPTALGVFAGIRAIARRLHGGREIGDHVHVVVQGLGAVGHKLARLLAEAGCRLTVTDVRQDVAESVATALGASLARPDDVLGIECDVFAPCALGAILDHKTIDRLRARAVAGSANNVLAQDGVGDELFRRGVLFAPDPVINAGALLQGALFHLEGHRPGPERVLAIGDRIDELIEEALYRGLSPERVAEERAARILADGSDRAS